MEQSNLDVSSVLAKKYTEVQTLPNGVNVFFSKNPQVNCVVEYAYEKRTWSPRAPNQEHVFRELSTFLTSEDLDESLLLQQVLASGDAMALKALGIYRHLCIVHPENLYILRMRIVPQDISTPQMRFSFFIDQRIYIK